MARWLKVIRPSGCDAFLPQVATKNGGQIALHPTITTFRLIKYLSAIARATKRRNHLELMILSPMQMNNDTTKEEVEGRTRLQVHQLWTGAVV